MSKTINSLRLRDRSKTTSDLKAALARLKNGSKKISIAAVAKEAEVTPALIHNRYPDFAEEIRQLVGKGTRVQRDVKHDLLIAERGKNRQLRRTVSEQMAEIIKLASLNEALRAELTLQRAIAENKVIRLKK